MSKKIDKELKKKYKQLLYAARRVSNNAEYSKEENTVKSVRADLLEILAKAVNELRYEP